MKKLLLVLPVLLIVSCSVQKRKYQSGYYVSWHAKKTTKEKIAGIKPETTDKKQHPVPKAEELNLSSYTENGEVQASAGNEQPHFSLKKPVSLSPEPGDTCDLLVFKDGSEIKARIETINKDDVSYKRCDNINGPLYTSRKSELFMIKYANGTREVIKSDSPPQQIQTTQPRPRESSSYRQQRYTRMTHPYALWALALGIASLVIGYISLVALVIGLIYSPVIFVIPFLLALAAVINGKRAVNRIREQPEIYKGKGPAIAGFVMGMVVLGIYAMFLFILFLSLMLI